MFYKLVHLNKFTLTSASLSTSGMESPEAFKVVAIVKKIVKKFKDLGYRKPITERHDVQIFHLLGYSEILCKHLTTSI